MAVHGTHNAVHDERNDHILIYVNGEFFPRNEAKISVFDSGYLVGDGIWEAIRLHDDVLVFLDEHLNRLWQAAATVGMKLNITREELTNKLWETLRVNDMHDNVHVRFMLTRGTKKTPSQDPRLLLSGPNLVIIPDPIAKLSVEYAHDELSSATDTGPINWRSDEIRRDVALYLSTGDEAERALCRQRIAAVLQRELPVIPIVWYEQITAVADRIQGFVMDPFEQRLLRREIWSQA